jgi:hypothetical protein
MVQRAKMWKDKGHSLKDMEGENNARAEHKTGNRSSNLLEVHPIRPGVGDTITLPLEAI